VIGVANVTSSTSSISSSTSTSASSSTATDLPNSATGDSKPSPSSQEAQAGMSTGAKAGIGIGVALLVIIAVAGIAWFILRQKRKQAVGNGVAEMSSGGGLVSGELPGTAAYQEMGSKQTEPFQHEVAGGYVPVPVHELSSTRYS
jgi:hypothetical protein